jgi:hypothetical protein
MLKSPPFLMWYDDNPKLTITRKIEDAIHAYSARFQGVKPTLVLVNEEEITEYKGVQVRGAITIRRNTIWVGQEEAREA